MKFQENHIESIQKSLEEIHVQISQKNFTKALSMTEKLVNSLPPWYQDDKVTEYRSLRNLLEYNLYMQIYNPIKDIKVFHEDFQSVYYIYGFILFELQRYEDAIIMLEKSINFNPINTVPLFELAEVYKAKKDWKKFLEITNQCHKIAYSIEELARVYRNLGFYYTEQKKYDIALALVFTSFYFDITDIARHEIKYISNHSGIDFRTFSVEKCVALLQEYGIHYGPDENLKSMLLAFSIMPDLVGDKEMRKHYYQILQNLSKYPKPIEKSASSQDTTLGVAKIIEQSYKLIDTMKREEALPLLETLIEKIETSENYKDTETEEYLYFENEIEKAIHKKIFKSKKKVILIPENYSIVYYLHSFILMNLNESEKEANIEKAKISIEKAIKYNPVSFPNWDKLALIYLLKRDWEKFLDSCTKIHRISYTKLHLASYYSSLGFYYHHHKIYDIAGAVWKMSLMYDPTQEVFKNEIDRCFFMMEKDVKQKDIEDMVKILEENSIPTAANPKVIDVIHTLSIKAPKNSNEVQSFHKILYDLTKDISYRKLVLYDIAILDKDPMRNFELEYDFYKRTNTEIIKLERDFYTEKYLHEIACLRDKLFYNKAIKKIEALLKRIECSVEYAKLKERCFSFYNFIEYKLYQYSCIDKDINQHFENFADVYYQYGIILNEVERKDDAKIAFEKARVLNPTGFNILNQLVRYYSDKGENKTAFELNKECFNIAMTNDQLAKCYQNLLLYYMIKNEHTICLALDDRIQALNPNLTEMKNVIKFHAKISNIQLSEPTTAEAIAILKKYDIPLEISPIVVKIIKQLRKKAEESGSSDYAQCYHTILLELTKYSENET